MKWIIRSFGHHFRHRTITHYVTAWAVGLAFAIGLWDFHEVLAAFIWGGLSHVLADSLTVMGVPFLPYSNRRFHLFGGRLRTGNSGEYFIAWGLVGLCLMLSIVFKPHGKVGWYSFLFDWARLYQDGMVDAKE